MSTRTLILHHGALGDCLLLAPLLRGLLDAGHAITLGQSRDKARLMQRVLPDIAIVDIETPAWAALFQADATPDARVQSTLAEAQCVFTFLSQGENVWARNLRRLCSTATLYWVKDRPVPGDPPEHLTMFHQRQLAAQGLNVPLQLARLREAPSFPVLTHPGSGGQYKCWPRESWESLLRDPAMYRLRLTPVLGEVELETWPASAVEAWVTTHGAIVCESLDALYDQLSNARGLVAADCGPAHLAAAMGLPVLSLFGPTCPVTWSPAAARGRVIAPPLPCAMDWLSTEQVKREMMDFFGTAEAKSV